MTYLVRNRKTGKTPSRKFKTREAARAFKRMKNFNYDIVQATTGKVVR